MLELNGGKLTFPWVVADVGGTNARFALVTGKQGGEYLLSNASSYQTAEFDDFVDCYRQYLRSLAGMAPGCVCLAMAGPVSGDRVKLTNAHWRFSLSETRKQLSLDHLVALNDFAALACAVPHLSDKDLLNVADGVYEPYASKAIVGPGTGLGFAGLMYSNSKWLPVPGEGGLQSVSPFTDRELAVFVLLRERMSYVCIENLLSGSGLVNIYRALADLEGLATGSVEDLTPQHITDRAMANSDAIASEAVQMFLALLGSVCSDAALIYGAKGGVYLGGGILPRIHSLIKESDFLARFRNKGIASDFVASIGIQLIVHPTPALIGAAAWLESQSDGELQP